MGGLFDKPKPVEAPIVPDPPVIPDEVDEASDQARRKRPRGRAETFLTGDLTPEVVNKKTLLG
jgi:hypothetical protein